MKFWKNRLRQVGNDCLYLPQRFVIPSRLSTLDSLKVAKYLMNAIVELADGAVLSLHACQHWKEEKKKKAEPAFKSAK